MNTNFERKIVNMGGGGGGGGGLVYKYISVAISSR